LFDIEMDSPHESLPTDQLRARFQSIVVNVFSVLAQTRLFALFLDDLHEADASLLDMVHTLANSKSRMIIFITMRSEDEAMKRARAVFSSKSRTTWVELDSGLALHAVASLVSKTLRRPREECAPLATLVHHVSHGNAFAARSFLMALHRQRLIFYDWEHNYYQYDIKTVETSLAEHKGKTDPTDPQFLISQLRSLHKDAHRFVIWASLFGPTYDPRLRAVPRHSPSGQIQDPGGHLHGALGGRERRVHSGRRGGRHRPRDPRAREEQQRRARVYARPADRHPGRLARAARPRAVQLRA
jgi:predicted ATPase